jgi:hypothetical protein
MVTLESLVSGWLFGHKPRLDLLAGLGRMASFVLGLYVVLRVGDLWWRGQLTRQVMVSWQGGLFVFEMLVSAVIPALLLSIRRVRLNIAGLATCSAMHGLCVRCHKSLASLEPDRYGKDFARCDVCHREFEDAEHRRMAPYVPMPPGHADVPLLAGAAADPKGPVG